MERVIKKVFYVLILTSIYIIYCNNGLALSNPIDQAVGVEYQRLNNALLSKGHDGGLAAIYYSQWINNNFDWKLSLGYWKLAYKNTDTVIGNISSNVEDDLSVIPIKFSLVGKLFSDRKISPYAEGGLGVYIVKFKHLETWHSGGLDILMDREEWLNNLIGFHAATGLKIRLTRNLSSNLEIGISSIPARTAGAILSFAKETLKDFGGFYWGVSFNYNLKGTYNEN